MLNAWRLGILGPRGSRHDGVGCSGWPSGAALAAAAALHERSLQAPGQGCEPPNQKWIPPLQVF
eukprot:848003-Pelagomonas_calceolata.AAC.4